MGWIKPLMAFGLYTKRNNDDVYILKYKLNQDDVENLVVLYHQKGVYIVNPTVRNFRGLFRSNSLLLEESTRVEESSARIDELIKIESDDHSEVGTGRAILSPCLL